VIDVDLIQATLDASTPGEWGAYFNTHGDPYVIELGHGHPLMHRICDVATSPSDYGRSNAMLLGQSKEWLTELVAEVRELREDLKTTRAELDACVEGSSG
jgi:hypothetical protein